MTKILSVFSRFSSTYLSLVLTSLAAALPGRAGAGVESFAPLSLTTVLPLTCWGATSPLRIWVMASLRSARRFSSAGLGSSSGPELLAAAAPCPVSAGGAANAAWLEM